MPPQGQVLEQQVHIRGLEHQLLGVRQSQQELLAAHAATLSTVEAELLAARAQATLQVRAITTSSYIRPRHSQTRALPSCLAPCVLHHYLLRELMPDGTA